MSSIPKPGLDLDPEDLDPEDLDLERLVGGAPRLGHRTYGGKGNSSRVRYYDTMELVNTYKCSIDLYRRCKLTVSLHKK